MGIEFNADEIFEIAERIEQNGARFYRKAAAGCTDERVRQMLEKLASMEDDHERTFAEMRAALLPKERESSLFDPEDEQALYLRAFADGHVVDTKGDPSEMLTGGETVEQILKSAIGLEKDSIVFYLGIRDLVPKGVGKQRIDDIIGEERRHIATLAAELSATK